MDKYSVDVTFVNASTITLILNQVELEIFKGAVRLGQYYSITRDGYERIICGSHVMMVICKKVKPNV